jgi:hypothetical protein
VRKVFRRVVTGEQALLREGIASFLRESLMGALERERERGRERERER